MDRQVIAQTPINETQSNLKNGQITTIFAIDKVWQSGMDGFGTRRKHPNMQKGYGKSQPG
jgi:hypothetical protein